MVKERENQEVNELLKNQIFEYGEFVKSFVAQNAIMSKNFFVVVPFDPVRISEAGGKLKNKITLQNCGIIFSSNAKPCSDSL